MVIVGLRHKIARIVTPAADTPEKHDLTQQSELAVNVAELQERTGQRPISGNDRSPMDARMHIHPDRAPAFEGHSVQFFFAWCRGSVGAERTAMGRLEFKLL
jgi:hypothetical protein